MVNPNVALACASAGAVLVTVSFFLGIAFMTSDSFATAGLGCNPEVLTNTDAQTLAEGFCSDNVVTDAAGTACQIANLGLYTAAYTPECTQGEGSPYALSALLAPESGAPSDITVLFPSQTSLGSLPAALTLPDAAVPEFKDCDSFFAGSVGAAGDGFASLVTTAASVGNLDLILSSFLDATKASYDSAITDLVDLANSTLFASAPLTFVATTLGIAGAVVMGVVSPDVTVPVGLNASLSYTDNLRLAAAAAGIGSAFANAAADMIDAGLAINPSGTDAYVLATIGYDNTDVGIPPAGLWGSLESAQLCDNFVGGSPCTAVQYVDGLAVALTAMGGTSGSFADLATLVFTLSGAKELYRTNVQQLVPTLVNDTVVSAALANPAIAPFFLTSTVVSQTQLAFNSSLAEIGNPTGFPSNPGGIMALENSAMSLLCGGVGELSTCTTLEFLTGTVAQFYENGDNDTAASAEVVRLLLGVCDDAGQDIATCFAASNLLANPAYTSAAYRSIVAFNVFGSLYGLEEDVLATGEAGIVAAMVASCKDSEKDLAAISLVQSLAPAGTALIGLGAIISIVNLLLRNDKVKVIGIVAGVLSLIGVILVLVGLLTLQGAPIYSSLGAADPDPLPDNATTFSLGPAYTLVLAFLGGAIVGSIVAIIGGALLSPKESSTDILGKA